MPYGATAPSSLALNFEMYCCFAIKIVYFFYLADLTRAFVVGGEQVTDSSSWNERTRRHKPTWLCVHWAYSRVTKCPLNFILSYRLQKCSVCCCRYSSRRKCIYHLIGRMRQVHIMPWLFYYLAFSILVSELVCLASQLALHRPSKMEEI